MGTRYWIGVVGAKHAEVGNNRGICAFSHGKKEAVSKLSPGDRFAFEADFDGYPAWVRAARYDIMARASIKPLLEPLEFVKNPNNRGMAVRRSLF